MKDNTIKKRNSENDREQLYEHKPNARPIRRVHPLGMRVLVKIRELDEVTGGGLYLPENARLKGSQSLLAEVMQVACAVDDQTHEETNISGIPLGALVLIEKESGIPVPWDDALRIVETKEVLALVDEVELV